MPSLGLLRAKGRVMGARHSRLAAALAAAWESEVISARTLSALSERAVEPATRARLMVLAAFCRAHASRLLAPLSSLGRGPLPVPPQDVSVHHDLPTALLKEASFARQNAVRYESMADMARRDADLSSA